MLVQFVDELRRHCLTKRIGWRQFGELRDKPRHATTKFVVRHVVHAILNEITSQNLHFAQIVFLLPAHPTIGTKCATHTDQSTNC